MVHTGIVGGESKRKLRAIKRVLSMITILTFWGVRWETDSLGKNRRNRRFQVSMRSKRSIVGVTD